MREMKDSGVAWIGEIPETWEIKRIKEEYSLQAGFTPDTKNESYYDENGYDWVTISDIEDGKTIFSTKKKVSQKYITEFSPSIIPKGSLLYSFKLSVGQTAFAGKELYSNEAIAAFFPDESISLSFLRYSSFLIVENAETNIYGAKILNRERIKNALVVYPPLSDQQKIAAHLDRKCTQIDALISNAQQQIEKLKAYKQSLITETVTKGLNPDVPMKDSGVEWIGEIPEDWKISKVGLFYEILLGKMLQPNSKGNDTLEKYLCATNVGGNKLSFNTVKEMWFSKSEKEQYLLKKGDLLVVEGGDVASSAIIEFDIDNIYYQNALHRVRAKKGLNEFLRYWLMSAKGLGYFDMICNKATIAHFTKDKFSFLPLVVLSLEEQQAIVSYLDQKCTQIDSLIAIKQRKIEKLQQYKKSLIYEYVTGKKEV